MIFVQGDHHLRHHYNHQSQLSGLADDSRSSFSLDRVEPFSVKQELASLTLLPLRSHDSTKVDEDLHLTLAHQMYKTGSYEKALEHNSTVYERNPASDVTSKSLEKVFESSVRSILMMRLLKLSEDELKLGMQCL